MKKESPSRRLTLDNMNLYVESRVKVIITRPRLKQASKLNQLASSFTL